jgi:teichoic acid transport system ATP-binding protein
MTKANTLQPLIDVQDVHKIYRIYNSPVDRVWEALDIFKLKQHYRPFEALRGITFQLFPGEVLGIIGPNGAGKSTLLKIISGVMQPDGGVAVVNGTIDSLLELGIAFNPELDGYENIDFFLKIKRVPYKKQAKIKKQIIEFSGIEAQFLEQPLKTYSSGMFARLAFASAVHTEFDILIVDEVLSVGDENFQNKCINLMIELSKKGKAIIFVSHNLHSIKYFCDKVFRMEKGKIIDSGNNVVDIVELYEKNMHPFDQKQEVIATTKGDSVKITKTEILNAQGKPQNVFELGENIKVKITYQLNEYTKGMFFGVGLRNSKGDYVNGLNTKIDGVKIPQKLGTYTLILDHLNPTLYKDSYTLWSVCYNGTGTVVLSDYIIKNGVRVDVPQQKGEGIIYIDHEWNYTKA